MPMTIVSKVERKVILHRDSQGAAISFRLRKGRNTTKMIANTLRGNREIPPSEELIGVIRESGRLALLEREGLVSFEEESPPPRPRPNRTSEPTPRAGAKDELEPLPWRADDRNDDLQAALESRGADTGGTKAEMVERLQAWDDTNLQSDDGEPTEGDES